MRQGLPVYSPIVHCHEIAGKYMLPTDFEYWRAYNLALLRHAKALYVLAIDGYKDSKGVFSEREFAAIIGIKQIPVNQYGQELPSWP